MKTAQISHDLIICIKKMTRPSKRKARAKKQERNDNGTFTKKSRIDDDDDWGNEDDSGWNEVILPNEKEKNCELVWTDSAHLEQKKRGSYLIGKTKKSTYFDKYGPSGSFTKAAKGIIKISTFMNKDKSTPDDFVEVLDDMDEEEQNQLNIVERIENLKIELKEQQKILTVTEYNKKRALYKARTIQYWANFWLQNNHLPINHQGKHQKTI